MVNCISTGSNSLCSALKEALIEYHQLLSVPRTLVLDEPEFLRSKDSAAAKEKAAPANAETQIEGAPRAEATKPEANAGVTVDAAGDGEVITSVMVSEDPVGEVVLDVTHVNSGIEQLELDDSLC